jgi:hypothetical protein
MQISELKAKQQGGSALPPEQIKLLEGEADLQRLHEDLKKKYPRVAKKLLAAASESASVAHPKTHEYFYVLPNCRDDYWHDVYQQRLDSDDRAASKVKHAILASFPLLQENQVEVVELRVDLFNSAYMKFDGNTHRIYRPKAYVGHSATSPPVHRWRPQNKRFLVRVPVAHSHHVRSGISITVENVDQLPTELVTWPKSRYFNMPCPLGIDFEHYEKKAKKEVGLALDANAQDVRLSLCSPFLFAVQASLACPHLPNSQVDLSALGTAFLDIIKVHARCVSHVACVVTLFSPFAARPMAGAHLPHLPLIFPINHVSYAQLLRSFS